MKVRVIQGGLSTAAKTDGREDHRSPDHEDVRREAERRLGASGYHRLRVREFAVGVPMPSAIKYLAMQIEFAVEAICRLDPIPVDFYSDLYWPKLENITTA
ncbi:hypothetical protein FHX15_004229 [Rhizobium sp. BK650]|uniref:hypothetical protein n=1 Tax=Rhizobium sp. BK650 TaxID=2586990 RepID=UPI001617ADEE|nr:hypothetical protein [Rhizobium sp. BK650]MBB3658969.1 hypothetical protein [Rhizobium sp. BK650]